MLRASHARFPSVGKTSGGGGDSGSSVTIDLPNHGFLPGDFLHFDGSVFSSASSTSLNTLATHFVLAVPSENSVTICTSGVWLVAFEVDGVLYLADDGQATNVEPVTNVRQILGSYLDGVLTLDIQTHVLVFAEPTSPFPTNLIVGFVG